MNDLVSIIMPSYNTSKYIKDSIQSVINQTYTNWELIIVDDCSTDNTDEVVRSIIDDRIHYIKNEKNSGVTRCFFHIFLIKERGKIYQMKIL